MTIALESVRPRTASELGDEVRAIDAPVRCCALPSCPRPAADGSNVCGAHGGPLERASRSRPMTDHEIGAWLSSAGATSRYWASRYDGMARVHVGTRPLGDYSERSERYVHIAVLVDVLFAVTRVAPRDVMVSTASERDFLQRLHVDGGRVAASLGAHAMDRRGRDVEDLIATALGGLRREVRALLGVVA